MTRDCIPSKGSRKRNNCHPAPYSTPPLSTPTEVASGLELFRTLRRAGKEIRECLLAVPTRGNPAATCGSQAELAGDPPQTATALYGRGIAKRRNGNSPDGDTDIAQAKLINPRIAEEFAGQGIH